MYYVIEGTHTDPNNKETLDPITKKEYNFQQGFSMDGVDYPAYSVSMQTNLYSLAKKLKDLGFNKQANKILSLIK